MARPTPARALSGRLQPKLLLATLLPASLALGGFGFLAHEVARRSLEDELGRRLAAAAAGASMLLLPEQIQAVQVGGTASRSYATIQARLDGARGPLAVRRMLLVTRDLTSLFDSDGRIAFRAHAYELGADQAEIERAFAGHPAASPLFWSHDGRPYKRAYAAVGAPAAGLLAVEASADFYTPLAAFRRSLVAWATAALAGLFALTLVVGRRITKPLERLAAAAERIGRGDLDAVITPETRDEIGSLAVRLDEMRAALRARDERTQMMLAGIAHEVRNPLGGMELFAGLLREGLAAEPDRLMEVARIEREIAALKAVVNEFLDYARRPRPDCAPVLVQGLLDEVREVAQAEHGHTIIQVERAAGLVVHGDRGQLRRALLNLVANAYAAAGPDGRVVLAGHPGPDGRVWIDVRDSGPGIPLEQREAVFQPFFTTRQQGTGLGLAFVREIARDHGGDVTIRDAPEGGAWFRLELAESSTRPAPA